jgi:hypothetical protein
MSPPGDMGACLERLRLSGHSAGNTVVAQKAQHRVAYMARGLLLPFRGTFFRPNTREMVSALSCSSTVSVAPAARLDAHASSAVAAR